MSKPTEPSPPPSAEALRARRARALRVRFALGVGLPTAIAAVYYLALATPQYDATATIAIESAAKATGARDAHVRDAQLLADHLHGYQSLTAIDPAIGLLASYEAGDVDWWSRLRGKGGSALRYYQKMVDLEVDRDSGAVALRARAFAPAMALALAQALIHEAEGWVTARGTAAREQRLPDAEARVTEATAALRTATGAAAATTAPTGELTLAVDVARQQLTQAITDRAELEAELARTRPHLVVVRAASVDDEPAAPRRAWAIATVAAVAFALVAIASLLLAAIREHASH